MINTMWFGPPSGNGYFGIGYDPFHGNDFPMWLCSPDDGHTFKEVAAECAQFVLEGVGLEGKRWADIYYVDMNGKTDNEFVIRIGIKETT